MSYTYYRTYVTRSMLLPELCRCSDRAALTDRSADWLGRAEVTSAPCRQQQKHRLTDQSWSGSLAALLYTPLLMSLLLRSRAPSPSPRQMESKLKQALSSLKQAQSLLRPALRLGKAAVTGIGIPGVEGVVNGVVELGEMVSTMRGNKVDLVKLKKHLDTLDAVDSSNMGGDLKQRVETLKKELHLITTDHNQLAKREKFMRFFDSKGDKEAIQNIQNSIVSCIQDFTFHGTISIEKLVGDMVAQ
ncbi:hypothetical protein C8F04DRAFT_1239160, partial [Mycena alexandri]